jgi:hypothetical protein
LIVLIVIGVAGAIVWRAVGPFTDVRTDLIFLAWFVVTLVFVGLSRIV